MALTIATLAELQAALQQIIAATTQARPTTAAIFQLMFNTGLRVREVLEVERWTANDDETYTVQLEKREGTRRIELYHIPESIEQQFASQVPFTLETYSSVNNTFKYYGIGILFGNDTRPTTCHAFRYQYIKQLSEDGLDTAQIAAIIGHVNTANTSRYITDPIYLGS